MYLEMFVLRMSYLTDSFVFCVFFFQAEDGIRDLVRSRGLGDVYKRQVAYKSMFSFGTLVPVATCFINSL